MTPRQTTARTVAGAAEDAAPDASAEPLHEASPSEPTGDPSPSHEDDTAADTPSGLGPSLVEEEDPQERETPQPPPKPAPIDRRVWRTTCEQTDKLISALARLPAEPSDVIDPIADGIYPLVEYYAGRTPSVASLWLMAGLSALAYSSVKIARYRDTLAHRRREEESGGDQGTQDEIDATR